MSLAQVEVSVTAEGRKAGSLAGCVCPACRGALCDEEGADWRCATCEHGFPVVAGVPDLRLRGDRYLSLQADRDKAARLAQASPHIDFLGLAEAYYAMTEDVDARRGALYRAHLARAEERGRVLAGLLPARGRVLEVGCGSGGLLTALAGRYGRRDADVVGVDIALRWLVLARKRLETNELHVQPALVAAAAEQLPWPDCWFDAVVADSVLEHLADPSIALREWARVLRPGGRLLVWSPNRLSLARDPHVGLWGVGWLPDSGARFYVRVMRRCDWHLQLLSSRAATRLATAAGFEQVTIDAAPAPLAEPAHGARRLLLRGYEWLRRSRMSRGVLCRFGPLWQLTAVRAAGGGR